MGNYVIFVLCLVVVYTQLSWAKPCHHGCGCDSPCAPEVKPAPLAVLDLGYAPPPPCPIIPEPYVYKGPPLPVVVKEPYPYIPPVVPVPAPIVPEPCTGHAVVPAPCCPVPKLDKLGLLKLALQHGKLHCDCKKLALKQKVCKHLLNKYKLLCGCA
ncbi:hypothetical protein M8J76_016761 [Diaphorina citri]|nr:hypothetical protein M8J75_016598 [Diaphorina citri]KAI5727236.1 hypothetical protein M8J76_016761 [Diaphorina citri]KAI5730971.1 hypothetical protein M8J77_002757 [Diaphorina citri]